MLAIIQKHNAEQYSALLEEMFRLRCRVFHDKLKWDVSVKDGKEIDKYDDQDPVYLVMTDTSGQKVVGSLRLLPTTGPTLLSETFSDTLPDAVQFIAPSIWECTRFCVDERTMGNSVSEGTIHASRVLFAGLGEVALQSGIQTVLGNFDAVMYRLYRRIGLEVAVLGETRRYHRKVYLGSFPVNAGILSKVKSGLVNPSVELIRLEQKQRLAA